MSIIPESVTCYYNDYTNDYILHIICNRFIFLFDFIDLITTNQQMKFFAYFYITAS